MYHNSGNSNDQCYWHARIHDCVKFKSARFQFNRQIKNLAKVSHYSVCIALGEEIESQLQLREQAIYRLKQEVASLREEKDSAIFMLEERIKEVESENEELRNQVQILKREDGTSYLNMLLFL